MEATADLSTALDLTEGEPVKLFWDGLWWKGEDKHWNDNIDHLDMERFGRGEKFVVLDQIKKLGLQEFSSKQQQQQEASAPAQA